MMRYSKELFMKKSKIFNTLGCYLNLEHRLKTVEDLLISNDYDNSCGRFTVAETKEKCKSWYSKIEFAQLFYILMDERLLFFDLADQKTNRSKFQLFLENNFTYAGDDGTQTKIKSISRQFSECKGYTYKQKQIQFLEQLITKIQERKNRLENW